MNHYVTDAGDMGRGVFATQDLEPGKILFTAELLILSPKDTVKVNETDLQYYTFKYNETQDCLVLGDGEIFNHSEDANIGYKLIDYAGNGRKVMVFYTLKPVEANEQLFINYGADTAVDVTKYTVNL